MTKRHSGESVVAGAHTRPACDQVGFAEKAALFRVYCSVKVRRNDMAAEPQSADMARSASRARAITKIARNRRDWSGTDPRAGDAMGTQADDASAASAT